MKIDKRLNLTFTIDGAEDGEIVHIHSVPISTAVFEKYYLPISKVVAGVFGEGLGLVAGPRVATLLLRQIAENLDMWKGPEGVEKGLMAEIRRLTNAVVLTPNGWDVMPIEDAYNAGLISEESFKEAESQVAFFTFVSAVHRRKGLADLLKEMCGLWAQQTSYSNVTEYKDSLPTSTQAETTDTTEAVEATPKPVLLSSIPH